MLRPGNLACLCESVTCFGVHLANDVSFRIRSSHARGPVCQPSSEQLLLHKLVAAWDRDAIVRLNGKSTSVALAAKVP